MRVRAGEKVIDDVRTEVHDGTLQVTFDHDGWGGDSVVVDVSVPRLAGIEASGKTEVYRLTPEEKATWPAALLPVHEKMESRIGKDLVEAVHREAAAAGY